MVSVGADAFYSFDPELNVGFGSPQRQRRLTVLLRGLLVVPQLLALMAFSVAAFVVAIIGWFAALALGHPPRWIATYEMDWIAYSVRVNAYTFLLLDEYPPFSFSAPDYPIAVQIEAAHLSRLKVFFRWLLAIPVYIAAACAMSGLIVFSPVLWLVALVLGRMPQPFFSAAAAVIRYQARVTAYGYLATDRYPRRLFGDNEWELAPEDFRVSLSEPAKWLTALIVVIGVAVQIARLVLPSALRPGRNPAVLTAEARWEGAALNFADCEVGCSEAHDRAFGKAFHRFASDISRIRFSGSQRVEVAAMEKASHQIGAALLDLSKLKTVGERDFARQQLESVIDTFSSEVAAVLGPGPVGIIR